jgi:GGDEF domain-containing protein
VYTVVTVLFFLFLGVFFLVRMSEVRDTRVEEAARNLANIVDQIEEHVREPGETRPQSIAGIVQGARTPQLRALIVYRPGGMTEYLWSRDASYLMRSPGSTRSNIGNRLENAPIPEQRFVRSPDLEEGGNLVIEAVYGVIVSGDAYPVLRTVLVFVAAFTLLTALILVVFLIAAPRKLRESAAEEAERTEEAPDAHASAPSYADDAAASKHTEDTTAPTYREDRFPYEDSAHAENPSEPPSPSEQPTHAEETPAEEAPAAAHAAYEQAQDWAEESAGGAPHPQGSDHRASPEASAAAQAPTPPGDREAAGSGLFSAESGLTFEEHLDRRLALELERAAYNDQDLSVALMRFAGIRRHDERHKRVSQALLDTFSFEDLMFEYGDDGFFIVLPNVELNQALRMTEEFKQKVARELRDAPQPAIGLTARSGRLVEASRITKEAGHALQKAMSEDGGIIGFRPDPQKYRQFVASRSEE